MHTTAPSTHPTTQLDLVRGDAADRELRAATYRLGHEQRPTRRARRSIATSIAATLLALGLAGGAVATVINNPLPHGYEPGQPDGWYVPGSNHSNLGTAEGTIRPAPSPTLRLGYETGRPDGWYVPGTPGVEVAGVVITRTAAGTVPHNVR